MSGANTSVDTNGLEVAIVGMAGRFPGARSVAEFWRNLREGLESVSFFTDEELLAVGVESALLARPDFVRAGARLADPEHFDAAFFGYSHREAELIDPQQRVFLECAHEALEHAGYGAARARGGRVGVFAGSGLNTYLINIASNRALLETFGPIQVAIANDKDYLATRVSYKLDLEGPSVTVQTACSTSLVAVHLACRSLLGGDCDVALAGGVSINSFASAGYVYQEGGILSPDGHCRAFDAGARGTVFGSGAGVVVLKRLEDALADGDTVYAVVKGSAINNDGAAKIGYTAPRADGQAEVIRAAQLVAEVEPETISYVEAHGTGTQLGDPIELAALTQAFAAGTSRKNFCGVGSLKTNVGHLDAAAGVAGLIKTTLALRHELLPPSINFEQPNPSINFEDSPFYVNAQLAEWKRNGHPRRAGVSSFGIGGTNAHVVLEEAPPVYEASPARERQLLVVSARTRTALEAAAKNLAAYLNSEERASLADVAFTLQVGREAHAERLAVVCGNADEAADALEGRAPQNLFKPTARARTRSNVFMFPGQGTQHPNMAVGLYRTKPAFRAQLDRCAELLRAHMGRDLRELLFPAAGEEEQAAERLKQTELTQPALFAVEYALAHLWMEWGVRPAALIGHSVGEYVAACVAGVFTLEDALRLISARGRLLQRLPAGAMLAVPLAEARVTELLGDALSLAAVNAPGLCVVSGPAEEVEALRARLAAEGVECSRLHTSHAFHSRMMEPALAPFVREFEGVTLRPPSIPFVSNVTGTWITDAEATSPEYWARHLRRAVRFAGGLAAATEGRACALFEVGPGRTLSTLARQQFGKSSEHTLLASLPRAGRGGEDAEQMLASLGQFWAEGGEVDWTGFHAHERRRRVPLPTYPFERKRYCIESARSSSAQAVSIGEEDAEDRLQQPALHPRPELQSTYVAPEGEVETRVAIIWQELLGAEQVGAEDNFFELGGHSLLATQAVSRLRQEFRVEIPLQALFEGQTVRGVARAVATAQALEAEDAGVSSDEDAILSIPRLASGAPRPLSFAQQRLWFLEQVAPGGALHNMPIAVNLRGRLDLDVTRRALEEIVARHDSLRTTFAVEGHEAVQVIAPSLKLELPVVDLSGLPVAEREAEARRLEREEQRRAFDLARGPLVRACVLRLAGDEHTLLLTLHHIISDAWSFAVFTREFSALYRAFAAGRPSPLAELPVQYADFAAWQRGHLSGGVLAEQLDYWRRQLEGAPPLLALPTDRPRPSVQSHEGATLAFELPAQLVEGLKALARREGATLFMTLLAAFNALLYRYAGQADVVVAADIAGRNRRELEGLIGFFVNMLVLRTDCSGNPTFTTLLSRVRAVTLGAYAHQDVPFDKLVEELQPPRTPAHSPLFQVVFNYYQDPSEGLDLPGLEVGRIGSYPDVSKFDLSLFVGQRADGVGGFWSYSTALFDGARIERLQGMFETLLASVVADPGARLDALDVTPEELKREQARARRALKESGLKKFKSLKPRTVTASPAALVRAELMGDGPSFPLVVRPDAEDIVDLAAWLAGNVEFVETNLLRYGALLFRGFGVDTLERFDGLTRSLAPALLDYNEPSSPRSEVGRKIYTSTEYPASQWIQLHNEMSYTSRWPHKVFFCCLRPAEAGGETPIAASREVFRLLDPHITRRFIEKRVMYVRNFSPGLDLPWQHVFQTDSPAEVEDYCRAAGIEFEWRGPDRLRTRQVQQSVIRHARTGDLVWFNQAHAFHAASLESSVRAALGAEMGEDEFPRNAYYGDGTPIEDSVIDAIRDAYRRAAVSFPWQRGDVLVLENMLFAHGRAPFKGSRKVLVAMSGLVSASEVDTVGANRSE